MASGKAAYQDEAATINTNSYSIVSKRSVEKLYYSHQAPFLEPFVPNFKRRAPLINRGYWLRGRAIESAVETFLSSDSGRTKAIVNLGCGYDPLPFRLQAKGFNKNVRYIDVDYRDLIDRKVALVNSHTTFQPFLDPSLSLHRPHDDPIRLQSSTYCAIGCDMSDVAALDKIFTHIIPLADFHVMFVAEVSITYMTLAAADELLKWASKFPNGEFPTVESPFSSSA